MSKKAYVLGALGKTYKPISPNFFFFLRRAFFKILQKKLSKLVWQVKYKNYKRFVEKRLWSNFTMEKCTWLYVLHVDVYSGSFPQICTVR